MGIRRVICRLHLSSLCVVSICQSEEEGRKEEPDLSLKSNNPTLKGGELKCHLLDPGLELIEISLTSGTWAGPQAQVDSGRVFFCRVDPEKRHPHMQGAAKPRGQLPDSDVVYYWEHELVLAGVINI